MNVSIECVNEINNNVGDNVVNVIINESFGDRAVVDTSNFLSYVDYDFCKKHNLHVIPPQSGGSRSYVAAGEPKLTAIGSTDLILTFAEEKFVHNFQIIDGLFTNILIGVDFMSRYNCVANFSQGIFPLGNALIGVPLGVKGYTLGCAGLREHVTLHLNTQRTVGLNSSKINKQPICLVDPTNGVGIVSIAQGTAAEIYPPRFRTGEEQRDYPRPNSYGNRYRRYSPNRVRASLTNFLSESYGPRKQNYCPWENNFAQNNEIYLAKGVRASQTNFRRTQNSYFCYLSGAIQRGYPRPHGYVNKRHMTGQVRASRTNFGRTQNSYLRNQSFGAKYQNRYC